MSIDAQGGVFIDQRLIHFDTLEAELKKIAAQDADPNVQLHADESVRYGRVAQVLALLQRVGITNWHSLHPPAARCRFWKKITRSNPTRHSARFTPQSAFFATPCVKWHRLGSLPPLIRKGFSLAHGLH